jgi:hypothetical protein
MAPGGQFSVDITNLYAIYRITKRILEENPVRNEENGRKKV